MNGGPPEDWDDEDEYEWRSPVPDHWEIMERLERQSRRMARVENPVSDLERTKESGESWAEAVYESAQETSGVVSNAWKIKYEEDDGIGHGRMTGPGSDPDWDPDTVNEWIAGDSNLPLGATLQFDYNSPTSPSIVPRVMEAVEPNEITLEATSPDTGCTYKLEFEEENGSHQYSLEFGSSFVESQRTDLDVMLSVLDILGLPARREPVENPIETDEEYWQDDELIDAEFDSMMEDSDLIGIPRTEVSEGTYVEDYDAGVRIVIPDSREMDVAIWEGDYAGAFSMLQDGGFDIEISAAVKYVTTEEYNGGTYNTIHHDPSVTVGNDSVSFKKSLDPESAYMDLRELEELANHVTDGRLTANSWTIRPYNVDMPGSDAFGFSP